MRSAITTQLAPVRLRRRLLHAMRGGLWGAGIGAAAALLLRGASPGAAGVALIALPLVGAMAGFMQRESWAQAAAAVDDHYALKDRIVTALAFSQLPYPTALHELAIADALEHLSDIDAKRAAPLRLPRGWWSAAALFAAAWAVALWPAADGDALARVPAEPIPGIVAEAQRLQDDFAQFDTLARAMDEPAAMDLAEQLRDAAERMQQPDMTVKDALATLSRMQTMLSRQQAAMNLDAADEQFAALGEAIALDRATAAAGRALKRGDYDAAAAELDAVDDVATDAQTAAALSDVAATMRERGLTELADETARLVRAMEQRDADAFCRSCSSLAGASRRQAQRQALAAWMRAQMARLSECKSACAACNSNGSNAADRSNQPSQTWGVGSSDNPQGDATQLDATRHLEQITGRLGEGPIDTETLRSPEARQIAGRDYRDAYAEYRRMSEAVIESEAIPLGHRQTIRRYFEAIRPGDE
jgi:hypothetical protein